jgi:hypothetical protein
LFDFNQDNFFQQLEELEGCKFYFSVFFSVIHSISASNILSSTMCVSLQHFDSLFVDIVVQWLHLHLHKGKVQNNYFLQYEYHKGAANCLNQYVLETSYYEYVQENGPLEEDQLIHK